MKKNIFVALLCLFFGGFFGAHHFYLGRFRHGIIYLFTFGGFTVGVFYDLLRLNAYVRWANFDAEEKERHLTKIRENPIPEVSLARGFAIYVIPQILGNLVRLAIPQELLDPTVYFLFVCILVPFAIGFGVWYVGSVGEYQGSLVDALKGAYLTMPLHFFDFAVSYDLFGCVASAYFFRKTWSYRLKPEEPPSIVRGSFYIFLSILVMSGLFASMVAFNCTIENEGEQVKCRDALRHFFKSPLWQDILTSLRAIKSSLFEGGFRQVAHTIVLLMDPTGELYAYSVLGVTKETSDEDIRKAYRELSKKYHPDKNKFKTAQKAQEAEQYFMEVQSAFETLQVRKSKTSKERRKT